MTERPDLDSMPFADALSPLLGRLRVRYAQSALPGFFAWWGEQLRDCVPAKWRHLLAAPEQTILLTLGAQGIEVAHRMGTASKALGSLDLPVSEVELETFDGLAAELPAQTGRVLLLPAGTALRRVIHLPVAALNNARTMAGFEIDRQTPFRADQVVFDCLVPLPAAGARTVAVELAVIPKEVYRQQLERIGGLAGQLDAVDLASEGGGAGFNFLPAEARRRHDHRPLLINAALLIAGVFCVMLAMAQLVDNRLAAVSALEAEVETQRSAARATAKLRGSLEDAVKAANFLAEHRSQQPSMLELLRLLTDLLPDDTYVERMTYSGDTASISIQSSSAAQMVERLQAEPRFENPALVGAIQPDPRSGKDRATLTVRFVPQSGVPE